MLSFASAEQVHEDVYLPSIYFGVMLVHLIWSHVGAQRQQARRRRRARAKPRRRTFLPWRGRRSSCTWERHVARRRRVRSGCKAGEVGRALQEVSES